MKLRIVRRAGRAICDKTLFLGVMATVMLLDVKTLLAQGGLGDIGENVASNMSGLARGVQYGAFFLGLVSFVAGIMEFRGINGKPGCTVSGGVIKCAVGAALLGLGAFLSASSTTIFGTDESDGLNVLGL